MPLKRIAVLCLAGFVLAACDKLQKSSSDTPPSSAVASAAAGATAAGPVAPLPDVGKIEAVKITAEGQGGSAADAVDDAIRSAVMQVNGVNLDINSTQYKLAVSVAIGRSAADIRSSGFAQVVEQRSGGTITGFRVVELSEPIPLFRKNYKATIEASMAKFTAPADTKKIRIAVAPIKFDGDIFVIGGQLVRADKVAQEIRQQVLDALTGSGRFAVLDRDTFGKDIARELDMISSGQSPSAETSKLGQAVSADIIWLGRINSLAYYRQARKLSTSDRELVGYSGGWSVSQRIVNVATRQLMLSDSLQGSAPSIAPTTLGTDFDPNQTLKDMQADIVKRIVASILGRTFPVTVASRDGHSVVLSQGGQAVQERARYALVSIGAEIKDPQTGQVIGRTETPCCEVVIDKVTPTLSYGHLENVSIALDKIPPGGLQLREQLAHRAAANAEAKTEEKSTEKPGAPKRQRTAAAGNASAAGQEAADNKW